MEEFFRSYAAVDTGIIRENFLNLKKLVPEGVKALAVVKTDAYGHGAAATAKALSDVADFFAVASVCEAVELRQAGIANRILILGYISDKEYKTVVDYGITPVIFRYEDARKLDIAAQKCKEKFKIHIAADTGMGRIGFRVCEDGIKEAEEVMKLSHLETEGVFSHFACADEENKEFTKRQAKLFEEFIEKISEVKRPEIIHIANSAGIIDFRDFRYDMVRAGIAMYGYYPSDEVNKDNVRLRPALEWHAHVTNVKTLHAGDTVSYGAECVLERDTEVATVSVGYGDGYPRRLGGKGSVLINGRFAKILGRVCMDQIMVDVTGIPDVVIENDVVLIGKSGNCEISADDIAGLCGTISYEILCDIGKRVPRIYSKLERPC